MLRYYFECFLFMGYCLLNAYVLVTFSKWSLGLILLYSGHRLTRVKHTLTITGKAVLITGCDTGFGHHVAKRLNDRGFMVFAGVLNENSDGAEALRSRKSHNLSYFWRMKRIQREMDYMWEHASDDVKKTYGRYYLSRNPKNSSA